jgi:VTC domain
MERVDTKYVFEAKHLPGFLNQLTNSYRLLDIEGNRLFNYESLYYDTPSFDLYNRHHQGKMNRFKIRFRKYVESNLSFFEVKYKNNKGRTIKRRIRQDQIAKEINGDAELFLQKHSSINGSDVEAKMFVNYKRLTLVNHNLTERVTVDLDLNYLDLNEKEANFNNLAIIEIKQDKAHHSKAALLLKKLHIREGSISKYCLGAATLFLEVRKNNFKFKINQLNKIQHGIASGY